MKLCSMTIQIMSLYLKFDIHHSRGFATNNVYSPYMEEMDLDCDGTVSFMPLATFGSSWLLFISYSLRGATLLVNPRKRFISHAVLEIMVAHWTFSNQSYACLNIFGFGQIKCSNRKLF